MAVIQVHIPEKLWARLQQTGRPVEDIVVEVLEKSFENSPDQEKTFARENVVRRLIESGTVVSPAAWDDDYAAAWLARPEDERRALIVEMEQEWHPGSLATKIVSEGRR